VHDLIPLARLEAGRSGVVAQVAGSAEEVRRLNEIGLRQGVVVDVLRSGSPLLVRLGGVKLGLRTDEVAHVLIRPGE
jgi:Fe2+ transport system protein FeoA